MQRAVWAALFLLLPLAAPAQSVITIAPQQCVYRFGDDPVWAAPTLDESTWRPYSEWTSNPAQPHLWVRCHADLSSLRMVTQPAIQVSLSSAYELYLQGVRIGAEGNLHNGNFSLDTIRSYSVSNLSPQTGSDTLALRITDRILDRNATGGIANRDLIEQPLRIRAGEQSLLLGLRAEEVHARSSTYAKSALSNVVIAVIAVMLLGLFFYDRGRPELLLLSLACLSNAGQRFIQFSIAAMFDFPVAHCLTILFVNNVIATFTVLPFFFALAKRRIPVAIWALLALSALSYTPGAINALLGANEPPWLVPLIAIIVPIGGAVRIVTSIIRLFVFWPYNKVTPRMRPLAAFCILYAATDVVWFVLTSTGIIPLPGIPDLSARWRVTLLEVRAFNTACALTALLALLFREQRQVTEERAILAGEVQAARSVQRYLIPEHLPDTPGLAIQSEYHPAREVGGDFFQVLPQTADGSLLIVIGDVAGKGVEAGMLATLIVGAVRTAAAFTSDPARILDLLNERLRGRGLVTCLALSIEQDGSATLVNAGHLPPYLNGQELAVEGSLPLGAAPGITFPVSRFQLADGDSLILMTDGVAEAQNAQGQLFGFERITELLHNGSSGAALADAAQSFGQQDDITILTLTRQKTGEQPKIEIATPLLAQA